MPVLLSKASKMPGKSWSLQAGDTCPGSINPVTKEVIEVCADCYAKTGFYRMDNVRAPRLHNRKDWKRPEWADDMVVALDNERWFRWFDSGDIYTAALAQKIYEVARRTPWCNHWIPSKSYNIPKIRYWLDKLKELPNVSVRFSSPSTHGEYASEHGSVVIQELTDTIIGGPIHGTVKMCDAYTRGGKCGPCRACWDKEVSLVVYPLHTPKKKINLSINRVKKVA
jgi:hypothetical protein